MLSEIMIYKLTVSKIEKVPFLFFFKKNKKEIIDYILTYRIDEDRFWYYKNLNNSTIDEHLMKSYLDNSLSIMNNIRDRYTKFNSVMDDGNNSCDVKVFSLKVSKPEMYELIKNYSDSKENMYIDKNSSKRSSTGIFLTDDINTLN